MYKATEIATGQTVAIKMMSNKVSYRPEFRTFFETEARTLQELDHPSIVKITDDPFADQAGNYYLPMAFVEGKTITQKIVEQHHRERDGVSARNHRDRAEIAGEH